MPDKYKYELQPTEYILVVDDHPINLQILANLLEQVQYRVRIVDNGREAINIANSEQRPILILLDIMMPDLDGYEVCEALKSRPETANIPIIFISALDDVKNKVKAFEIGGADYITKPFQLNEVLMRVQNQINLFALKRLTNQQNLLLQKLNQELEAKVTERTQELVEKNQLLVNLQLELQQALSKEQELNNLKGQIITTISHEYRTPLTTILTSSDMLLKYRAKLSEEKQTNHLHKIQISVKYLTELLEDIFFLNQANSEQINLQLFPLNIHAFCEEVIDNLKLTLKSGQQINFDYTGLTECGYWDKQLLKQIIDNLLSNAIKFSPENAVINFYVTVDEHHLKLVIQDRGIGIPAEEQDNLFEIFYRGNNIGLTPGTGMGLAIVKKSVSLMKGQINFTSQIDQGTMFNISLPVLSQDKKSHQV